MILKGFVLFFSVFAVGCVFEEEEIFLKNRLKVVRNRIEEIRKEMKLAKNSSESLSKHLDEVLSKASEIEKQFYKADEEYTNAFRWAKTKATELEDSIFRLEVSEVFEMVKKINRLRDIVILLQETDIAPILKEFNPKLDFDKSEIDLIFKKIEEMHGLVEQSEATILKIKSKSEEIGAYEQRIEKERSKLRKLALKLEVLRKEGEKTEEYAKTRQKYKINSQTLKEKLEKQHEAKKIVESILQDSLGNLAEIREKAKYFEKYYKNIEFLVVNTLSSNSIDKFEEKLKIYYHKLQIHIDGQQTLLEFENRLDFNQNKLNYYAYKYVNYPELKQKAIEILKSDREKIEKGLNKLKIEYYANYSAVLSAEMDWYTAFSEIDFSAAIQEIWQQSKNDDAVNIIQSSLAEYLERRKEGELKFIELSPYIFDMKRVKKVMKDSAYLEQKKDFYISELEERDQQLTDLHSDEPVLEADKLKFKEFIELKAKLKDYSELEVKLIETVGDEPENSHLWLYLTIALAVFVLVWMGFEIVYQFKSNTPSQRVFKSAN